MLGHWLQIGKHYLELFSYSFDILLTDSSGGMRALILVTLKQTWRPHESDPFQGWDPPRLLLPSDLEWPAHLTTLR